MFLFITMTYKTDSRYSIELHCAFLLNKISFSLVELRYWLELIVTRKT